jgi:hypothetical protein
MLTGPPSRRAVCLHSLRILRYRRGGRIQRCRGRNSREPMELPLRQGPPRGIASSLERLLLSLTTTSSRQNDVEKMTDTRAERNINNRTETVTFLSVSHSSLQNSNQTSSKITRSGTRIQEPRIITFMHLVLSSNLSIVSTKK